MITDCMLRSDSICVTKRTYRHMKSTNNNSKTNKLCYNIETLRMNLTQEEISRTNNYFTNSKVINEKGILYK